jgi:uncharacterized protein (DUF952 family)
MKLHLVALGFVLLSTSVSAEPASLDLARRYVAVHGGMTQAVLAVHMPLVYSSQCVLNPRCAPLRFYRFKMVQLAIDQDQTFIASADEQLASMAAKGFDKQELETYLAFWESPLGQSIQHKQAAAGISFFHGATLPVHLTRHEQEVLAAYSETPAAKQFSGKENLFLSHSIPWEMNIQIRLAEDAGKIYCGKTGYCTPWVSQEQ